VFTPYPLNDGQWHLVDVGYDGANLYTYYVDGQGIGATGLSGATATVVPGHGLYIGGDPADTNGSYTAPFSGSIDEVAIYPRALTQQRVDRHWTEANISNNFPDCGSRDTTSGYAGVVNPDHPLVYYPGHNIGSVRALPDYSGNCYDGAFTPDSDFVASGSSSQSNSMVSGDFSTAVGPAGIMPTAGAPRTVEAWINTDTIDLPQGLVSWGNSHLDGEYFGMQVSEQNSVENLVLNAGNGVSLAFETPSDIADGRWHQLAISYDGTTARAYLDGSVIGSAPIALNTAIPGQGIFIGGDPNATTPFAGSLDDVAVYQYPLTADQINAHWSAGSQAGSATCSGGNTGTVTYNFTGGASGADVPEASGTCRQGSLGTNTSIGTVGGAPTLGLIPDPQTNIGMIAPSSGLPAGAAARTVDVVMRATWPGTWSLVSWGDPSPNADGYFALETDGPYLCLNLGADRVCGKDANGIGGSTDLSDGNWHQVAVTLHANGHVDFFADGQNINDGPILAQSPNTAADHPLQIGGNPFDNIRPPALAAQTGEDATYLQYHQTSDPHRSIAAVQISSSYVCSSCAPTSLPMPGDSIASAITSADATVANCADLGADAGEQTIDDMIRSISSWYSTWLTITHEGCPQIGLFANLAAAILAAQVTGGLITLAVAAPIWDAVRASAHDGWIARTVAAVSKAATRLFRAASREDTTWNDPLQQLGGIDANDILYRDAHVQDHIGKTDADLVKRFQYKLSQYGRAKPQSTYTDLATAEESISNVLAANDAQISQWVSSTRPGAKLEFYATFNNPIGRVLPVGQTVSVPGSTAIVVLRRAKNSVGYYILTSFVEY
jgi:hypothetical protein